MSFPLPSQDPSLQPAASPTSGARGTRLPQGTGTGPGASGRQPSGRGLTPIATAPAPHNRPTSSSESPSRNPFSPTGLALNHSSFSANRQAASRQSSTSSTHSLTSPSAAGYHATGVLHPAQRSRAVTNSGSPRLASSLANLSSIPQGGGGGLGSGGGSSRLSKHSPSLSGSTVGSPVSSTFSGGGGLGQLTSLVITQLNILLSTLKENNFVTQAEKIRRLVDDNGMEVFTTYFRRLLHSNASTIFPGATRASAAADQATSYQMLVQETQKLSTDPQQAEKIAQSLDTSEGELFKDFDLAAFIEHFGLDPIARVALVLCCRTASKTDLRSKGLLRSQVTSNS